MLKRIILFILVIGVIGGIANYMYNKPPRNIAEAKKDFTLNANQFYKVYESNEDSANKLYLEKVIEVQGKVVEIQLENEDEPSLALGTDSEGMTIRCGFKKELLNEVKTKKMGDKIKVKGKCDGMDMFGVVITQCSFVKE